MASAWARQMWSLWCRRILPKDAWSQRDSPLLLPLPQPRSCSCGRRAPAVSERSIRADELDVFVFDQVRATLLHSEVLLSGEAAISMRREPEDGELIAAQLARLDRKLDTSTAERRRLGD